MKFISIIIVVVALYFVFYKGGQADQTEQAEKYAQLPYINVYGRQSCGYTTKMIKYLKEQSLQFRYFSVDDKKIANTLHSNMRAAGLDTRHYYLPVVEVNRQFFIRPNSEKIKSIYMTN